jgi:hypothetical protein
MSNLACPSNKQDEIRNSYIQLGPLNQKKMFILVPGKTVVSAGFSVIGLVLYHG